MARCTSRNAINQRVAEMSQTSSCDEPGQAIYIIKEHRNLPRTCYNVVELPQGSWSLYWTLYRPMYEDEETVEHMRECEVLATLRFLTFCETHPTPNSYTTMPLSKLIILS